MTRTTAATATVRRRTALRALPVPMVLTVLAALGGCGSNDTPASTTTSISSSAASASSSSAASASATYPAGKEQICAARDQLQTSLGALVSPTVLAGGSSAIGAAIETVKTDLSAVTAAGKQDYATQVDALQAALQDVQSALSNLGTGGATAAAGALTPAIAATQTAAKDLFDKLSADCD